MAARRLAVLGDPVEHSRSPAIHNAAFAALGLGDAWRYEAMQVGADELERKLRALPVAGFVGANVTIPHKIRALELADDASPRATAIGAANTLAFRDERILADNTDGEGLIEALPASPAGSRTLVLGAGGAGRACCWALADAGAEVTLWNRTRPRAQHLGEQLGVVVADERALRADDWALIVNATSVGMAEGPSLKALPFSVDSLSAGQIVVDLVYRPRGTELGRAARTRGATVVDGLDVLVHQGAASFRIWTGLEPSIEVMRRAAIHEDQETGGP